MCVTLFPRSPAEQPPPYNKVSLSSIATDVAIFPVSAYTEYAL